MRKLVLASVMISGLAMPALADGQGRVYGVQVTCPNVHDLLQAQDAANHGMNALMAYWDTQHRPDNSPTTPEQRRQSIEVVATAITENACTVD